MKKVIIPLALASMLMIDPVLALSETTLTNPGPKIVKNNTGTLKTTHKGHRGGKGHHQHAMMAYSQLVGTKQGSKDPPKKK